MVTSATSKISSGSKQTAGPSVNPWQKIGRGIQFRFPTIQVAANLAGVVICVTYFVYFDDIRPVVVNTVNYLFSAALTTVLLFFLGATVNYFLIKPILRYVAFRAAGHNPSSEATLKVQQRLLNMPP